MNEISSKRSFPRSAGREMTLGEFLTATGGHPRCDNEPTMRAVPVPVDRKCLLIPADDCHNFINNGRYIFANCSKICL